MKNIILLFITLLVGLSSCEKERFEGRIKSDPDFVNELRSSPETLVIENNRLILTTYLWRDFMPIAEKNGSKMICVNNLTEVDSAAILNTISLKKQYVVRGNEIWTAAYSEERDRTDFIIEGVVRGGPKWGPHIEVDVICEFENKGKIHRILAKSQMIHRTD